MLLLLLLVCLLGKSNMRKEGMKKNDVHMHGINIVYGSILIYKLKSYNLRTQKLYSSII